MKLVNFADKMCAYLYTMSYLAGSCDCLGVLQSLPVKRIRCNDTEIAEVTQEQVQRVIWNVVRAPSSLYVLNKAAHNVVGGTSNIPLAQNGGVNWNQMSDRSVAGVVPSTMNIPRYRTRARPGQLSAPGSGVDVKHDSYARYLARKKAPNMRTKKASPLPVAVEGNKQYVLGFIPGCTC
jgi:hypothetical protein